MTAEDALLEADARARREALDVSRSFIVQAPAGSGKTELLIQRYLRLLGHVEHPEEVLAITFTRKAAAEMQARVLVALERAARGEKPRLPHERTTLDAAAKVLSLDRDRNWQLAQNPHRLRIQTLDSLNASVVRAQPLTASSGTPVSRIAGEAEMRSLYAEAAVLTLDQLLEQGVGRAATEAVFSHLDNNTDLYVDYLARMLATRDQWLPFIGSGMLDDSEAAVLRHEFEAGLERIVTGHLERLAATLPDRLDGDFFAIADFAARALRDDGKDGHPVTHLAGWDGPPAPEPGATVGWKGLAELLLTAQGRPRKTVNRSQGLAAGTEQRDVVLSLLPALAEAPEFCGLLHETRELPPSRYTDDQWAVLLALFRLLPLAVTELKRLFAAGGVTDYIEVALDAGSALGSAQEPGDIALLLDYQLRHLLVDEMQDTSSAQYRMLEALTGGWEPGDGRTLFCVGDPMQSIYRFRNAEVGQFLVARAAGIGSVDLEPLTLRRNFRSGTVLVDWFNATFPRVLAAADDPARGAVAYAEAVGVPEQQGQGSLCVHPVFGTDPVAEAKTGCRVIRELLEGEADEDVAVLVRGRTRLPELLAEFRAAGVSYRAVDIDRLTDLPEIVDLLALTRALVHRSDRLAWLALLRAPWAGLAWCDLHALVDGAGDSTVWELLNDPARLELLGTEARNLALRLRDRLAPEISPQPDETLRSRVERAWLKLGGPATVTADHELENVYRFLDVLEGLEGGGTIRDVAELENLLDMERVSSNAESRLQIMTMHRAKGLQFDHVVLYGLGRTAARGERSLLSWFDIPLGHGDDEKIISPVGPRAEVENDPIHRFIERTLVGRDREEAARLLYVACTRARRSLHLVGHTAVAGEGDEFRPPRSDSLLAMLWPAVARHYEAAFTAMPADESVPAPGPFRVPVLRRFTEAWRVPEPEALPGHEMPLPDREPDPEVDYDWVGSGARLAGTLVHRWLQLAGSGRLRLEELDAASFAARNRRWLIEAGADAAVLEGINARITAAIEGVRRDPRGTWLLEGEGHCELALSGIYNGRIESVVLDRVRVDDDGTHWIVDYKTSTHEGGGREAFLEAEAERYAAQLEKYRVLYAAFCDAPIRCALYFPLLGAFVEVPGRDV